ncbi:MAG: ribosomal RNA small subunit methyltransferase I [Acidimicrobiia bacterium]|nr:MAG: ribosomal RNA small subunit methyltransferase I [Acidimicrobiia bacterium]
MTGGPAPRPALVLVATPIGNLGDLSPRAVEELRAADVIAAEDTRRTRALLSAAGVPAAGRLRAVHAHNERAEARRIVEAIRSGHRVAYVSDAGTPGIADPGERLVRACVEAGCPVEVVPGPSALVAALVVSGLPAGRFRFEGFLPRRGAARAERLDAIARADTTVVLFESPHRVAATLADLREACGPTRPAAVVRELTKVFEDVVRGPLGEVADAVGRGGEARGEHVIVVGAAPGPAAVTEASLDDAARGALAAGASARDAAAAVARELGVPRRRAYDAVLRVRGGDVRPG